MTILMGANDVCASSEAGMTPVATFRAQFEQSLQTLTGRLPSVAVFVASVPDVARRERVPQRNIDYNTQLAEVCALYIQCRFDGNAVFETAFVRSDVSTRDYFHPSVSGQAKLAAVTWSRTFAF